MIKVRSDEPKYAFLWDKETKAKNCYGQDIELTAPDSDLRGKSLNINGNRGIGANPNRYKQHGFYFNADNCIGCHACESACSEKNDVPAHLAFRSVGFVEGGTYPDYRRINISMACNHCDDPVCLKGCPTRAYTKFAEYGAVLQDPDICFGCGYCTWVCPYNAPQLDPVKGQVSKCNMCVDRLEVGLKPACVAACLGNALDFGVIENIPENREQAKTAIPGFPTPDITHPNIRFQQIRSTHREMTRTDAMPIKYHRDDGAGRFNPVVDPKLGAARRWSLGKLLSSHENAHILFTLCIQATLGAFLLGAPAVLLKLGPLAVLRSASVFPAFLAALVVVATVGLYKLNMHLGKPHRFYRGFNNLKHSPVSREIAGVSLFYLGLLGFASFSLFLGDWARVAAGLCALLGGIGGLTGLYYMYRLYRIKARPFWDHWQTGTAFAGTVLSLGALLVGVVAVPALHGSDPLAAGALIRTLAAVATAGLAVEAVGHVFHARALRRAEGEGAASHYRQTTQFGYPYLLRNVLLGGNLMAAVAVSVTGLDATAGAVAGIALALSMLASAVIGRALFYVLVIPTTMPGAFFWKNQGFVEHARETGLADMPQVGVAYERHHPFKLGELIETVRSTPLHEMVASMKEILASARDILPWKKAA